MTGWNYPDGVSDADFWPDPVRAPRPQDDDWRVDAMLEERLWADADDGGEEAGSCGF